jgi:fumarate reductase (CoM/CoB) subunit A
LRGLTVDVLVVGGGLAALRAALSAADAGVLVALAVKGKAGRSGSSAMTSAGYSTARGQPDSSDLHFADTMSGGKGLNDPELVRIMVNEAPERLDELLALGAPLANNPDGQAQANPSGDHSIARTYVAANHTGRDFTEPLTRAVVARGVLLLEMTAIVDIVVQSGQVVGAIGVDYREGEIVVVSSPSIILGTGGAGRLFAVTSNPNDATGDGYALALRAGAQLRDMEFIQFYPWRCIVPFDRSRMPIQPSTFVLGGKLLNSNLERFMPQYDPVRREATTRDLAARGIYDQINSGLGVRGGVILDVSEVTPRDWAESNPRPARHFEERGLDYRNEEMLLAPEAHFFMGGVVIDGDAQSRVPGLFAVGEVAGGVHGANRLDSNAIPETQVFGARAGAAASRRRTQRRHLIAPGTNWLQRLQVAVESAGGDDLIYASLRRDLQDVMWTRLGISRSGPEMQSGLSALAELGDRLAESPPASARGLVDFCTLENSILVAQCCFMSAIKREESRGAHYRRDFPDLDDKGWSHSLMLEMDGAGNLHFSPSVTSA